MELQLTSCCSMVQSITQRENSLHNPSQLEWAPNLINKLLKMVQEMKNAEKNFLEEAKPERQKSHSVTLNLPDRPKGDLDRA